MGICRKIGLGAEAAYSLQLFGPADYTVGYFMIGPQIRKYYPYTDKLQVVVEASYGVALVDSNPILDTEMSVKRTVTGRLGVGVQFDMFPSILHLDASVRRIHMAESIFDEGRGSRSINQKNIIGMISLGVQF